MIVLTIAIILLAIAIMLIVIQIKIERSRNEVTKNYLISKLVDLEIKLRNIEIIVGVDRINDEKEYERLKEKLGK